jgi:HEPN domain-containing protein
MERNSSRIWFDIAESDLKAARILYAAENYRASFFMFQQAAEKANKAYGLMSGVVKEADLRKKIGHETIKIFKLISEEQIKKAVELDQILERVFGSQGKKTFSSKTPEYSFAGHEDFVRNLKSMDLIKIDAKKVNLFIDLIDAVETMDIPLNKPGKMLIRKFMIQIAEWIENTDTSEADYAKKEIRKLVHESLTDKKATTFLRDLVRLVLDLNFAGIVLYVSAIITFQHISVTRYPGPGYNPLKLYTKKLAVVREQEYFMGTLQDAISILKHHL